MCYFAEVSRDEYSSTVDMADGVNAGQRPTRGSTITAIKHIQAQLALTSSYGGARRKIEYVNTEVACATDTG